MAEIVTFATVNVGIDKGTYELAYAMFQSNVGQGLKPIPENPQTASSLTLLGAIQVIQLKADKEVHINPGKKNQTVIATNEIKKNFSRDMRYIRPKGPRTASLVSVWKALMRAKLASVPGQTANAGQTRNRRVRPRLKSASTVVG